MEAFTNVLEAHYTPKGLDNFGHLLDGYIIVRGPLRKVNLRHRTEGAEYSPFHLYVNRTSFGDGEEASSIRVYIDCLWDMTHGWTVVEPCVQQHEEDFYCL